MAELASVDTSSPGATDTKDSTPRSRHGSDADTIEDSPVSPTTQSPSAPLIPAVEAAEDNEETDDGDSLSPLPMAYVENDDPNDASGNGHGGGGGFFGAIRQRRRSSIPVIATAQGAGATLQGKIHGTCLCRISMRSYFMKDWKPCLWVFENGKQLYVFRDADAYRMYHENPYLDEETKKFLLKGYFVLGVNHGCKEVSHKEFGGEMVHGFSLEKLTDFGMHTCVKFGHKEAGEIEKMREQLKEAIDKIIAKRDEEEQDKNAINLEDVF